MLALIVCLSNECSFLMLDFNDRGTIKILLISINIRRLIYQLEIQIVFIGYLLLKINPQKKLHFWGTAFKYYLVSYCKVTTSSPASFIRPLRPLSETIARPFLNGPIKSYFTGIYSSPASFINPNLPAISTLALPFSHG